MKKRIFATLLCLCLLACETPTEAPKADFNVPFEKFELDNGLDVIFHIDRSDPVVAVALTRAHPISFVPLIAASIRLYPISK